MTPEELMKPRYKVIADYPDNKNKIGDIIPMKHAGTAAACDLVCGWYDRFTSIYKRLEWWEERGNDELPEYVMFHKDYSGFTAGQVFKVIMWHNKDEVHGFCIGFETGPGEYDKCAVPASTLIPATETEYNEYLKQKEANNG